MISGGVARVSPPRGGVRSRVLTWIQALARVEEEDGHGVGEGVLEAHPRRERFDVDGAPGAPGAEGVDQQHDHGEEDGRAAEDAEVADGVEAAALRQGEEDREGREGVLVEAALQPKERDLEALRGGEEVDDL